MNGEWGKSPVARLDSRPHLAQRLRDPVHGTAPDRLVPVEREAGSDLKREPARKQPHERAGVPDVDCPRGHVCVAQTAAAHDQFVVAGLDYRAELLDRRQRAARVLRIEVVSDLDRL